MCCVSKTFGETSMAIDSGQAIVARIEKGVQDRIEALAKPSDPNRDAPPQGGDGSTGAAGNVGGYNNFWIDAGVRIASCVRASRYRS